MQWPRNPSGPGPETIANREGAPLSMLSDWRVRHVHAIRRLPMCIQILREICEESNYYIDKAVSCSGW